jgi:diguanylate cyclase (GGDEF)-like protein
MKILIVQNHNNGTNCSLSRYLESTGHICIDVPQPSSAIDVIYRENPDIVMLSTHLRQPSCHMILERIKVAPSTRNIPVFYLAGRNARSYLRKGYTLGMYDYISLPIFPEEINTRLNNISQLFDKAREIEGLLIRDFLTGAFNRKFFMDRFYEEASWAHRYGEPISIIMIDIDLFKKINDRYGHCTGDHVLQQVSRIVTSHLRGNDVFARFGGEEFIILMPNTDADEAFAFAETLREVIARSEFYSDDKLRFSVTISAGVATFHGEPEMTMDNILCQADTALYQAKEQGRNIVIRAF